MANFHYVEPHAVEHHNEYYEVRITPPGERSYSVFFTTNDENIENVAAEIVADQALPGTWVVVPHRKKH